jgi:myo-inositol-1(or 4)-monophosphatase
VSHQDDLAFAINLAQEAGEIMIRYFRAEDIGTTWKQDDSPLTVADTTINKLVIDRVKEFYPDYGVLGEEESYEADRNLIWVVDPIDGTVPFSLGMPVSTFLLALVDRKDGQPLVSVTYDPYLKHMYTAIKGGGAFLNGAPIRVNEATNFEKGYVSVYGVRSPIKTETVNYQVGKLIDELSLLGAKLINISSGAYAAGKIATGEFSAITMAIGAPWDCASIALLVQEAGGVATDLEGKPARYDEYSNGCIIAANQTLLDTLLELIKV